VSPLPRSAPSAPDADAGRRNLYSSPLRPPAGRAPLPLGAAAGDAEAGARLPGGGAALDSQETLAMREELNKLRRRCVELARAERQAREEANAVVAASAAAQSAVAQLRAELTAAEEGLAGAIRMAEEVAAQSATDRAALLSRTAVLRKQLAASRDATEHARWDAAANVEAISGERARLEQRVASMQDAEHSLLQRTRAPAERDAALDVDDAHAMRVALSDAEARCASLSAQRDAALTRAGAAQTALTARSADLAAVRERLAAAESAASTALASQHTLQTTAMHAAEAARASAAERAALAHANVALQAQLHDVRRGLQELPTQPNALHQQAPLPHGSHASGSAPPQSEVDWASEVMGSESGSTFGDGSTDLGALRAVRRDRQREDARARALQNRAKFEAIKAERNALKADARRSAAELDALRAEAARVEELQVQLRTIQTSLFL
jgi:hypothetical protein